MCEKANRIVYCMPMKCVFCMKKKIFIQKEIKPEISTLYDNMIMIYDSFN